MCVFFEVAGRLQSKFRGMSFGRCWGCPLSQCVSSLRHKLPITGAPAPYFGGWFKIWGTFSGHMSAGTVPAKLGSFRTNRASRIKANINELTQGLILGVSLSPIGPFAWVYTSWFDIWIEVCFTCCFTFWLTLWFAP